MRAMILFLAPFLIILAFYAIGSATTYYVDCNVTSSGDGLNWENAFKNLWEGGNVANQPGDIVEIAGCIYNQSLNADNFSGVSGNPIITPLILSRLIWIVTE